MLAILTRDCYWKSGTYGILKVGGLTLYTAEQPWNNNRPFESCIPDGMYRVEPFNSPSRGPVWIITGQGVVKYEHEAGDHDRFLVQIHAANWPDQLEGCIAPGLTRDYMPWDGRKGVQAIGVGSSAAAMEKLASVVPKDGFDLLIQPFVMEYP